VLRGVNSEGKFRTAPAKEYPAEICKLIASAMHDFVVLYLSSGTCYIPKEEDELGQKLAKFYMPLDPYLDAHQSGAIGQDFAASTARPKTARELAKQADRELYTVNMPSSPHQAESESSFSSPSREVVIEDTPITESMRAEIRKKRDVAFKRKLALTRARAALHHATYISASPDNIDPVIRPYSVRHIVRTGSNMRNRFAFGRIDPIAARTASAYASSIARGARWPISPDLPTV